MIYACTVCDKNYILKGLNLYKSLRETCADELTLCWLCLDTETYVQLHEMNLPGVIRVRLVDLANYNIDEIRKLPNTNWGDDHANFCWRITPIFIDFLLQHFIPAGQRLIYADSDIFFYHSPQLILDIVGNKCVGIHTHRFSRPYDDNVATGWYNVGVMVFTANDMGKDICGRWVQWMSNPDTELYKKYGTCGDQKWLNLFIPTFGQDNICVFDEEGNCGHLAPWNCTGITHPRKHYIIYKGQEQPVVFFHFSHFIIDGHTWRDSIKGEWKPAADQNIRPYYQEYFEVLQSHTIPTV